MCLYRLDGNAVLIYVCTVHVCDIVRGCLKPSYYGKYILYLSNFCWNSTNPVVADYCILKGRLCLLCMAMFLSSGEIMQDCATANKPEYSARFRHSSLLGWVCLFAAGGGGG